MDSEERVNGRHSGRFGKLTYIVMALVLVLGLCAGSVLSACSSVSAKVVATVNGEEISREDFSRVFEQQKMQYLMQGIDLDSPEMADTLKELEHYVLHSYFIYPILLHQQAEAEGIVVSEDEREERYQEYADAFGGEEELKEQMEAAGMSREDLNKEIDRDLSIANYLDGYVEQYLEEHPEERIDEAMEVTGDDVEERYQRLLDYYNQLKEITQDPDTSIEQVEQAEVAYQQLEERYGGLGETNLDELKSQLEEEIRQERVELEKQENEQRIIMAHIEQLQEDSDIVIHL